MEEQQQQLEQPQHFAHGDAYNDNTESSSSELSSAAASDLLVDENDGDRNGSQSRIQQAGDFSDHINVAGNHTTAASVSSSSVAASELLDTMEEQSTQEHLEQAQQEHHDENETSSASSAAASELLNKMNEPRQDQQEQQERETQTDEENSPIKPQPHQSQDHDENRTDESPESFNGNEADRNDTLTNSIPVKDGDVTGITSTAVNVNFIPYEQHSTSRIGNDKNIFHGYYWIATRNCLDKWPRTTAVVTKIVALWCLICVALLFGYVLSTYEGPSEVRSNDAFMRERYVLAKRPIDETVKLLVNLPTNCMDRFVEDKTSGSSSNGDGGGGGGTTGITVSDQKHSDEDEFGQFWDPTTNTAVLLRGENYTTDDFAADLTMMIEAGGSTNISSSLFSNQTTEEVLIELYEYMERCEDVAENYLTSLVEYFQSSAALSSTISDGLSFNWIRCWNSTELGNQNPYKPDEEQIAASAQQGQFYAEVWLESERQLTVHYINEFGCDSKVDTNEGLQCRLDARERAANEATGGTGCATNVASSAFFWFTVMTTVGYGNMAPATMEGRSLVAGLGWLSIIAFGAITILSGGTWSAVTDDIFRRLRLPFLMKPVWGTVIWGVASIGWIALISQQALLWWRERVPDFAETVSVADSYWFAYITTLTVGLGDYYLQPEGFFMEDVFRWASRLLTGFVFISMFLGKFGELVYNMFVNEDAETLEEHLERTDCRGNDNGLDIEERKKIQALEDLIDHETERQQKNADGNCVETDGDAISVALAIDGRPDNTHRIESLLRRRQLILQLLSETETELSERMTKYRLYNARIGQTTEGLQNKEKAQTVSVVGTSIEWPDTTTDSGNNFLSDLSNQQSVLETALQNTFDVKEEYEKTNVMTSSEENNGMTSP